MLPHCNFILRSEEIKTEIPCTAEKLVLCAELTGRELNQYISENRVTSFTREGPIHEMVLSHNHYFYRNMAPGHKWKSGMV